METKSLEEENKPVLKRVLAYAIDSIIVTIIATLFANIEILNPLLEKYNLVYEDYYNYIYSITDTTELLSDSEILTNFTYDISYYSVIATLITIVISLLYFVVFQYLNNGKTIGKALFHLKVVDCNDNKPSIVQFLLRSLIINSIFISLVESLLLIYTSKATYLTYSVYTEYLEMGLLFVSLGMVMVRKDGRGLHDLLGKTKVVSTASNISYVIKDASEKEEILLETKNDNGKKKTKNEDSNCE